MTTSSSLGGRERNPHCGKFSTPRAVALWWKGDNFGFVIEGLRWAPAKYDCRDETRLAAARPLGVNLQHLREHAVNVHLQLPHFVLSRSDVGRE